MSAEHKVDLGSYSRHASTGNPFCDLFAPMRRGAAQEFACLLDFQNSLSCRTFSEGAVSTTEPKGLLIFFKASSFHSK